MPKLPTRIWLAVVKTARRVLMVVGGIALIAAAIVAGWLLVEARQARNVAEADHARAAGNPIPVRTARAAQSEGDRVIGGTALTVASKKVEIRSDISRTVPTSDGSAAGFTGVVIKKVHVAPGDAVRRGQLLIELDDRNYVSSAQGWEATRAAAESELQYLEDALEINKTLRDLGVAKAEAEVDYRQVDLETRRMIRDALEKLSNSGAAGEMSYYEACSELSDAEFAAVFADAQLSQAKAEVTLGPLRDQFEIARARAKRDQAAASLELARRSAESCLLRSPVDGFVDEVNIVAEEVARIDATLLQVLALDPIWVCMDFPQERIGELSIGQEAEIVIDSYPRETFSGKVVALLPQVRPQTRILPVYIEVANPGGRIKAGVSGFARIFTEAPRVVTVPAAAVLQTASRAMVFRVRDGRAHATEVEAGPLVETGVVEVRKGLAPGDEVVVFGNIGLRDGDAVDKDWCKWARRE